MCGGAGRLEVDHIVSVADGGGMWDGLNLQTFGPWLSCGKDSAGKPGPQRSEAVEPGAALAGYCRGNEQVTKTVRRLQSLEQSEKRQRINELLALGR